MMGLTSYSIAKAGIHVRPMSIYTLDTGTTNDTAYGRKADLPTHHTRTD